MAVQALSPEQQQRLRSAIIRRGMTQDEFCRATHLAPGTLVKILNGGAVWPSTIARILRYLEESQPLQDREGILAESSS